MDRAQTVRPFPRRRAALAAAAALGALAVSACAPQAKAEPEPEPVRLAALLPLSGGSENSGDAMLAAARFAVEEINGDGGVLGRPVELVVADDACDPQTAVMAANDVVAQDVVVSVSGYCSSAVVPTLPIFDAAGVPMIIPAANSTDLLEPGYEGVFLISATVASEAEVAIPWIRELGAASVAFVHDGTSYSLTLAEESDRVAREGGALTSLGLFEATQGSDDMRALAQSVAASGAGAVYFTGYEPDALQLAQDLRAVGYGGLFVGADGAVCNSFLEDAPDRFGGTVYATVPPLPQFSEGAPLGWKTRFEDATGTTALPYTIQSADTVVLAVDAIRRAGSTDPQAVRDAIAATDGLPLLTGRARFGADQVMSGVPFTLLQIEADGARVVGRRGSSS